MDDWVSVYKGNLGIVLPDTFGLKAFLNDFDVFYAKSGIMEGGKGLPEDAIGMINLEYSDWKTRRKASEIIGHTPNLSSKGRTVIISQPAIILIIEAIVDLIRLVSESKSP